MRRRDQSVSYSGNSHMILLKTRKKTETQSERCRFIRTSYSLVLHLNSASKWMSSFRNSTGSLSSICWCYLKDGLSLRTEFDPTTLLKALSLKNLLWNSAKVTTVVYFALSGLLRSSDLAFWRLFHWLSWLDTSSIHHLLSDTSLSSFQFPLLGSLPTPLSLPLPLFILFLLLLLLYKTGEKNKTENLEWFGWKYSYFLSIIFFFSSLDLFLIF